MEKYSEYLMWMKRKHVKAAGYCGGGMEDSVVMVWPPRSYSCSFCEREFRSAQALGGHMNVHRRDRANKKLKQSALIFSQQNEKSSKKRQRISSKSRTVSFGDTLHGPCLGSEKCSLTVRSEQLQLAEKPTPAVERCVMGKAPFVILADKMEAIDLELRVGCSPAIK